MSSSILDTVTRPQPARGTTTRSEGGFTLVELLVVITIIGILAAIVVFSVQGVGDKGQTAATATEESILRTAEESYCAANGHYGKLAELKNGFLASDPGYESVAVTDGGTCGSTGFVLGSTTYAPKGNDRILAASSNSTAFPFLASSYESGSGNNISFLFGPPGNLASVANGTAANGLNPAVAPAYDVLFASADEGNVDKTYAATGTATPAGALHDGTCTAGCAGTAATKTLYTIGQLAIASCRAGSVTLPLSGTPSSCAVSAKLAAAIAGSGITDAANALTVADLVTLHAYDPTLKVIIPDPQSGCNVALGTTNSVPAAPYGCAADQSFNTATGSVPTWLTVGSNGTTTMNALRTGAADVALVPVSFLKSPGGDDTNNWDLVPNALHDPIKQWAIVLNHGGAADQAVGQGFLNYLTSAAGQSVLAQFGDLHI